MMKLIEDLTWYG